MGSGIYKRAQEELNRRLAEDWDSLGQDCKTILWQIVALERSCQDTEITTRALSFMNWRMGYKKVSDCLFQCKQQGFVSYSTNLGWRINKLDEATIDTVQEGDMP